MNAHRIRNFWNYKFLSKFRSAHAAAKAEVDIEALPKQGVQIEESSSGITVASVENYSPISQVSVAIKAGSRYENGDNLGVSHCLRNCAVLSTKNHTAFSITRNLEIKGSKIGVTATREHLIYSLQCIRDEVDSGLKYLYDIITQPAFKPWELENVKYRMQLDLAQLNNNPGAVLNEMIHKAAFRGGLSNSLYSEPFMIGKHKTEMLKNYVEENFTASRTAVVGLGIGHESLQNSVDKLLDLKNVSGTEVTSKYSGGEIRTEVDIPFVHAAIVTEGTGYLNMKEMLSLGVLQNLLGTGSHINQNPSKYSKLGEVAAKSTNNPYEVSCININYSDTGLFGVYIAGQTNDMKELVKSIVSQMRNATKSISESDVKIGKHKLKAKLNFEREQSKDLLHAMSQEASAFRKIHDIKEIEKAIDDLKTSDISAVAAKVMKTKPSMAALGRLHSTPYLDELL